jgi:3-hydroxypropanoate dehydrogenase
VRKASEAPVTAIVAFDRDYLDQLPKLYPVGYDARSWFNSSAQSEIEHGLRNTILQASYLIIAARALGLDCGPMSGFDPKLVDEAFFGGMRWNSQLLVNLGYGAEIGPQERKPRLSFDEACRLL